VYLHANSCERPRCRHASRVFLHAHHRCDLALAQPGGGAKSDEDAISFGKPTYRLKGGVKVGPELGDGLDILVVGVFSNPVEKVLAHAFAANPVNRGIAGDTEQPGSDQTRGEPCAFVYGERRSKRLGCAILCCRLVTQLSEAEPIDRISVIPVHRFKVGKQTTAGALRRPTVGLGVGTFGDHSLLNV
jgi:hypothetical protein